MAYKLSKAEQKLHKSLIQRANRLIKAQVEYLNKNNITNEHARRSMAGIYADKSNWSGKNTPISTSTKSRKLLIDGELETRGFANKSEYDAYMRHISKWAGTEADLGKKRNYEELTIQHKEATHSGYKDKIIVALNEVARQYGVPLEADGSLPKEIMEELDSLSYTQITNFFEGGHPSEDMMVQEFDTHTLFKTVDSKRDFIDTVMARLGTLKKFR